MPHLPPHLFDEIIHKALSSNIRKQLLLSLEERQKYLSELAAEMKKNPSTIDFHLNILEEIGLIESEWLEGKKYYRIKDKKIFDFLRGGKAVPPEFHPKPPHEIVLDMWNDVTKRLDRLEKKIDRLER